MENHRFPALRGTCNPPNLCEMGFSEAGNLVSALTLGPSKPPDPTRERGPTTPILKLTGGKLPPMADDAWFAL